jgi:hypothetical protein
MPEQPKRQTAREQDLKVIVRTNLDSPAPTPAQLERKKRNTAAVKNLGLPTLDTLPVVEDASTLKPRSKEDVGRRCLATLVCAVKGEGEDQEFVDEVARTFSVTPHLSPMESAFLRNKAPGRQDLVDFAWRYECVHVFLWALGHVKDLKPPSTICEVAVEAALVRELGPEGFFSQAKPRPLSDLLDMADLYYRLHWAAIELRLAGKRSDAADEGIIRERHRALNWLIRYMGQAWDDVQTDT